MRIAYGNARYLAGSTAGGNIHIQQFITNAVALGHEVWTWPGDQHPESRRIPQGRFRRWLKLARMDVVYVRIEDRLPSAARRSRSGLRGRLPSAPMVWEFNTVPEFGAVVGRSEAEVRRELDAFRERARECRLAVCVSEALREYVVEHLCVERAVTVPNGSDPALFRPDAPPVPARGVSSDSLNVVWIGSAGLHWHNFDLLREAARLLCDRGDEQAVVFHVIGPDSDRLQGMPRNVFRHGEVKYAELPGWLSSMDVGLILYRPGPGWFSSPLKLFDYMASSLAVVSSPQPQVADILTQLGQQDMLVQADDPRALADLLSGLARDRDRVERCGCSGRQLVLDRYSWRASVRTIFEHLSDL